MSKYQKLWEYVCKSQKESFKFSFDEISKITGVPIDHSFLNFKKELLDFGYKVGKFSLKEQTVVFEKTDL